MVEVVHTYYPVASGHKRQAVDGISVADYVDTMRLDSCGPVICSFNGRPALRAEWPDLVILECDVVIFIHLPQGPDGGGSNPFRIVAMIGLIALSLAAPQLAPGLAAWGGGLGGSLISAGVMMAGSAIMNAVMPLKNSSSATSQISTTNSTAYSLSSPTNAPRIGQVIPLQYGRLKTVPVLISQPWSEYVDNDQWVNLLLCIGQGYYDVEQLAFGSLDFERIPEEDLEYEIVEPGAAVPYHDNIFTSPAVTGYELKNTFGEYISPTSPNMYAVVNGVPPYDTLSITTNTMAEVLEIDANIQAGNTIVINGAVVNTGVYTVALKMWPMWTGIILAFSSGTLSAETILNGSVSAHYEGLGASTTYPTDYPGGSVPYGMPVHCDINFPNGLFYMETDGSLSSISVKYGIVYQSISSAGVTGPLLELLAPVTISSNPNDLSAGNRSARRVTLSAILPSETTVGAGNRILIGLIQADPPSVDNRRISQAYWTGLRVQYDDIGSYPDITTLAVRVKASNSLNNDSLSQIGVLSTKKLPIWNGTVWSAPTATRSIAWAAADACRNPIYSIGLNDSLIDLEQLLALDAIWTARGDRCDGEFNTKATFWESLKTILRTGRAQPHMVGGSITFSRDQEQAVIKGVFGIRNIVRGSFSIDYLMFDPDTPDDIEVEYVDEESWVWKSVVCTLPGSSSESPASIKKWGITQADQAQREGIYDAACNMHRRTFVTFQTEMDARIILRGDLVSVSHPLPSWGISGEIKRVSSHVLELSEPVSFGSGDHYISFRKPDGSQDGPYLVTPSDIDSYHVVAPDLTPSHVYPGYNRERTHFQFGPGDLYEKRCLVLSAIPRSGNKVEILCVVENSAVHSVEGT